MCLLSILSDLVNESGPNRGAAAETSIAVDDLEKKERNHARIDLCTF